MSFCYLFGAVLLLIIILYGCFEIHYFIRTGISVLLARCLKKRIHILQETTVKGICITTDIDTFLFHMNNSRYLRELDFAKADFYERTGLYRLIRSKKGSIALGATNIRYRRFIKLFSRFIVTTKVIYWDDQGIYIEHRFITPRDGFINAIAITKTRLINCTVEEIMNELLQPLEANGMENGYKQKPDMQPELAKWIEFNEISHLALRGPTS